MPLREVTDLTAGDVEEHKQPQTRKMIFSDDVSLQNHSESLFGDGSVKISKYLR